MSASGDVYLMGFRRRPTSEGGPLPSQHDWLRFKHDADAVPAGLWRVHDNLYDLSEFDHPGGRDFMDMTKGTDITELFESSHPDIEKARLLLAKYLVGPTKEPRNCTLTFRAEGFYCQLRVKVNEALRKLKQNPVPYLESTELVHDGLLALFVICLISGMHCTTALLGYLTLTVSAVALALLANAAHNFFHQRNSWRMYTFDLTGNSSFEWRISHVYSHHCYPNSYFDYEASAFEAFVCWYPREHKRSLSHKLKAVLALGVVFPLQTILVTVKRYIELLLGRLALRLEFLLPLCVAGVSLIVHLTAPGHSLASGLTRLLYLYTVSSTVFLHVGLAATHHCPEIWHAGDNPAPNPNTAAAHTPDTMDWGVFQAVAVGYRPIVDSSHAMSAVSFGQHALHHMFPTVDQYYLQFLQADYEKMLKEHGMHDAIFSPRRRFSVWDSWMGMFRQIDRSDCRPSNLPDACYKAKPQ